MNNRNKNSVTIYFAILFVLCFSNIQSNYAQNPVADSVRYYISIARENWHNDLKKAQHAAKQAHIRSSALIDNELIAETNAQYGVLLYTKQEYDSAIHFYKKALNSTKAVNNKSRYLSYVSSALDKKAKYKEIFDLINSEIKSLDKDDESYLKLLLIKLSAANKIGFTEEATLILKEVESIYQSNQQERDFWKFLQLKGKYYQNIAAFNKSDSIFKILLSHYDSTNNKMDQAETLLFLAENAMEVSRYKQSSNFLIASGKIYDSLNYGFGKAKVNLNTGVLLSWMQNYNEASDYIYEALEFFEQNDNLNESQIAYYELGWIFYSLQLERRAKKYLHLALETARKIQNIKYLAKEHNAFGSLFTDLKKYDSAILHFDSAIYYQKITKNEKGYSAAIFNKALVLEKLGKDLQALKLYKESYDIDSQLKNYAGLVEGDWALADFYLRKNQLDSAAYYLQLGEKRAENLREKYFLLKIYELQAQLYSERNNPEKEAEYLKKALKVQKEYAEENKAAELATVETTYDLKNKEKELAFLNLQRRNNEQTIALNNKTISSQRNTLVVLTVGIIALLILSYIIYRYLKIKTNTNRRLKELYSEIQLQQEEILKQSHELKEANSSVNELNEYLEKRVKDRTIALENALSELDHFFYRASHDFRGPLTTLLGLVGVSKAHEFPQEAENLFDKISVTVKKLDMMVQKLQAVSFLGDFDNLKSPEIINLHQRISKIVQDITKHQNYQDLNSEIEVKIKSEEEQIVFYPFILETCLTNLLENSIAFNYSDKIEISVEAKVNDDFLVLTVQDNGIGISQDMQNEIFSMFKRTSQISTGNGLGLYIVKKAIDKLNGKIEVKSSSRQGSIFILKFPLAGIKVHANENRDKVYISS